MRSWRWILLVGCVSAAPVSASAPFVPAYNMVAADQRYAEASALLDTGRFENATRAIDSAISDSPQDSRFFVLRGRIQLMRGSLQEAQLAYSEAARLDPANEAARRVAASLARKADVKAYADGVEAFHQKSWATARSLLEHALARGNLGPEHTAIAQQYVVVATFAQSRVAEEIRRIQEARAAASQAYLARRITPADAESHPVSNGAGNPVTFVGRVLSRHDDFRTGTAELIVTRRTFGPVDFTQSGGSFSVFTPSDLPHDPRIARGAEVLVIGRLVDPPARTVSGLAPRVAVMADKLVFDLDRGGRGLAGSLRVDFLKFNEEQRANLPPGLR